MAGLLADALPGAGVFVRRWTVQPIVVEAAYSPAQTRLACMVSCGLQGRQLAAGCSLQAAACMGSPRPV